MPQHDPRLDAGRAALIAQLDELQRTVKVADNSGATMARLWHIIARLRAKHARPLSRAE